MRPVRQARAARPVRPVRSAARVAPRSNVVSRLKAEFERRGIRHVKLAGIDIDGVLRGKYISLEKFWSCTETDLGFCDVVFGWDIGDVLYDNGRVTGWHTGYPDIQARIDLETFRVIPWEPDTAAFLLDFVNADGSPYAPSPRQLLKRVAADAAEQGFAATFASEFEYFIFKETPESLRAKGFAGLTTLSPGMFGYSWLRSSAHSPLVKGIVDGCNAFGVDIEGMHTETGPGVYESAIRYDSVVRAGDKATLFKTAVKEICARHGVMPCFMAKHSEALPGSSGHLHQSLWSLDGTRNRFHDEKRPNRMSETMRHYLGGQMALMPELTALHWPTINSYKRSVENTWAPTAATWGIENRTAAVRVIPGTSKSTRIEYRQPGADMNPYIAMAACLAAGLYGIRERIEPPPPVEGNGYEVRDAEPLPRSLEEAVQRLKKSRVARELLGDDFVDHYVRTREWEVRQFQRAVTQWELDRYLESI